MKEQSSRSFSRWLFLISLVLYHAVLFCGYFLFFKDQNKKYADLKNFQQCSAHKTSDATSTQILILIMRE